MGHYESFLVIPKSYHPCLLHEWPSQFYEPNSLSVSLSVLKLLWVEVFTIVKLLDAIYTASTSHLVPSLFSVISQGTGGVLNSSFTSCPFLLPTHALLRWAIWRRDWKSIRGVIFDFHLFLTNTSSISHR